MGNGALSFLVVLNVVGEFRMLLGVGADGRGVRGGRITEREERGPVVFTFYRTRSLGRLLWRHNESYDSSGWIVTVSIVVVASIMV